MPSFRRSKGIPKEFQKQPGERVNRYSGTFVAYIKDNRDVQKTGRLKVWVPDFGGDPLDANTWIVATYASPFAGSSPTRFLDKNLMEYNQTQTSYGMWMIPPDVDNQVLITFASGDSTRCYWFACVFNNFMNQQVPGIGALDNEKHYGPETTTDDCDLPTAEYNKFATEGRSKVIPDDEKRPVQPFVADGLKTQGLVFDEVRGVTDSSARRESPSKVFGISTPGPLVPLDEGGREDEPYESRNTDRDSPIELITRKGGHQIIFDDHEEHEHIKLRTRSGAELLIDETNGLVYFINAKGTGYIEISESGHGDFYAKESFSFRTEKDFNIRADRDINIESGRDINIKAAKDYADNVSEFLSGYANSQQATIPDLFDDSAKTEYLNDFPDLQASVNDGSKTTAQAFSEALEQQGYPTTSSPTNTYSDNDVTPTYTSLTSVELLALIRGSHIVGEGFGDSGNVSIQGLSDINISSRESGNWSTEEGNLNFFAGVDIYNTAGMRIHNMAGSDYKITSGYELDISSGQDSRITTGGNLHLTTLTDTFATLRGDVTVLLEGRSLKVEAQPVKFDPEVEPENRILDDDTQHETIINLQKFDMSAEEIYITGKKRDMTDSLMHFKCDGEIRIDATKAMGIRSSVSITIDAPTVDIMGSPADAADAAEENGFFTNFPEVGVWADRAEVANTAILSEVPKLYSKVNVLPMLKLDGNKEYCISYHTQVVESITRRFMTHEPCVEHENTGNIESKNDDFAENLQFRILD